MSLRFLVGSTLAVALCAGAVVAADPVPPAEKPVSGDELRKALQATQVDWDATALNTVTLAEGLQTISKRYGVAFVIMEEQFKAAKNADVRNRKSSADLAKARGTKLDKFLTSYLGGVNASYVIRPDYVEIVPLAAPQAAGEAKDDVKVTLIVKEKPFNEVVEKLAEEYDLSIVIAPQSGDARSGFVSARLKNVPAADALELLAVQCDLRVIRKGNAFLITNRDHATDLFNEKLERERQLIELKQLRETPPFRLGQGLFGNPPAPVPTPKVEPKAAGGATLELKGNGFVLPLRLNVPVQPAPQP